MRLQAARKWLLPARNKENLLPARKQFQPVGKNFGDGIQDALVRPGFYSNQ